MSSQPTPQLVTKTAASAAAFVDSLGVNTHLASGASPYGNISEVSAALNYLGIHELRENLTTSTLAASSFYTLASEGYKFDFEATIKSDSTIDVGQFISTLGTYERQYPGSITAIEGPNEVNFWPVSYNGVTSIASGAEIQKLIYTAAKSDALLKNIPVYNVTIGSTDAGQFKQLGDLSNYTDYANEHAYVMSTTNISAGLDFLLSFGQISAPGKPSVITETGYTTLASKWYNGVDEAVQAKYTLNLLMDAYQKGVSHTYLYELFDEAQFGANHPESYFGLFHADGTPKPVASAIHNLTEILQDSGQSARSAPISLTYALTGAPTTAHDMVLAKSNGSVDLVLWAEPILWNQNTHSEVQATSSLVSVTFAQTEALVKVYDPLVSIAPIATYANVNSIQANLSDHPLVIEIAPTGQTAASTGTGTTAPAAPAAPVIVSFSPDTGVVGDKITSNSTPTLTGTAVAGSTVNVFDGSTKLGTATANSSGSWKYAASTLNDGVHHFTAIDVDSAGNKSVASADFAITIDTHAPAAPTLAHYSQAGAAVGATTTLNDLLLKGTAEANSKVAIWDGGTQIGTTTAGSAGTWSYDTGTLSSGAHSFTSKATDAAGNTSVASVADAVTVNASSGSGPSTPVASVAPVKLTGLSGDAPNHFVNISGTADANSQIKFYDNGTLIGSTTTKSYDSAALKSYGSFSFTTANKLSDTVHTITAQEYNSAGKLVGGSGAIVIGSSSADTLKSTSGNDILTGNGGADTFVFNAHFGKDVIKDFAATGSAHDVIQFSNAAFSNFASVLSHATQQGSDVVIASGADSLTLKSTKLGSLTSQDFHFA